MKLSIRTRYFDGYHGIEGTAGWACYLVDEGSSPEHAAEVTGEYLGFDTEEAARKYAQAQVEALHRGAHALGGTVADIPSGALSWHQAAELIRLGNLR